ncbi:hypothetical protein HPP92_008318 [Vanilla planifolia]|uniref:Uncharacterized protein n=1 Tax=Vanilla planifolia TaxID=51239 RepID=A0A835R9G1_VANPL|nr:hypothetical protein HPP92_008318 [Vanilla planifolia]
MPLAHELNPISLIITDQRSSTDAVLSHRPRIRMPHYRLPPPPPHRFKDFMYKQFFTNPV